MSEVARNFWVGLFVITGFSMLGILMIWFGETPSWLGGNEWELNVTHVTNLSGIGEGSPVLLNGVEIGRVKRLEFEDFKRPELGVRVVAGIENTYSIPSGSTARIYGATLGIGSGHIEIIVIPGTSSGSIPRKNASLPGEMRSIIGELISKEMVDSVNRAIVNVGNLTEQWAPVGTNLSKLLESRTVAQTGEPGAGENGITPNLSTAIERIDQLVANLNAVLGDDAVQGDVKIAVRDLRDASGALQDTMQLWKIQSERITSNVNKGIEKLETDLNQSFVKLNDVLENLSIGATSLATVLEQVEQGKGTAGLLASDDRLYEAAVLSLQRLADVMLDVKIVTQQIKEDGYIPVRLAPGGLIRTKIPITAEPAGTQ